MDEEIAFVKRFFESHHITLSDYWLESCVQWYREENPNSNYTKETLRLKVYEQWLLLDLRDVEVPILPANLAQQKKVVLNGTFALQMLYIVDISQPKLNQIQKLRNSTSLSHTIADQEYQPNISSKRVLQLLLTDSVQEIEAIEYKPVSVLNVNLPPGTKIRITGPITIRRGQMMLEERHVNILGGEVDELLVCNAAENILARALHMELNPIPNIISDCLPPAADTNVVHNRRNENNAISTNRPNTNIINSNVVRSSTSQQPSITPAPSRTTRQNSIVTAAITEDDELRIKAEVDELLEIERDIAQEHKSIKIEKASTSRIEEVETKTSCFVKEQISLESNTSIFEDMDIDAHLDLIDEEITRNKKNSKGMLTIAELLKNRITSGKFTIKAKFKSVVQKLILRDDTWILKLLITDETDDLEVNVDTDIISNLLGFCPSAIMSQREAIFHNDESVKANVMQAIDKLRTQLQNLDCLMDIRFTPNEACPTIISLK